MSNRFEKLLDALLNNKTTDITPQSRVEVTLKALIDGAGTEGLPNPQSTIEVYLHALVKKGIGGGGAPDAPDTPDTPDEPDVPDEPDTPTEKLAKPTIRNDDPAFIIEHEMDVTVAIFVDGRFITSIEVKGGYGESDINDVLMDCEDGETHTITAVASADGYLDSDAASLKMYYDGYWHEGDAPGGGGDESRTLAIVNGAHLRVTNLHDCPMYLDLMECCSYSDPLSGDIEPGEYMDIEIDPWCDCDDADKAKTHTFTVYYMCDAMDYKESITIHYNGVEWVEGEGEAPGDEPGGTGERVYLFESTMLTHEQFWTGDTEGATSYVDFADDALPPAQEGLVLHAVVDGEEYGTYTLTEDDAYALKFDAEMFSADIGDLHAGYDFDADNHHGWYWQGGDVGDTVEVSVYYVDGGTGGNQKPIVISVIDNNVVFRNLTDEMMYCEFYVDGMYEGNYDFEVDANDTHEIPILDFRPYAEDGDTMTVGVCCGDEFSIELRYNEPNWVEA